ncbi:MAG: cytochrome c [Verrucomicrobiota bacterium]|nr:cytochrome c [Verrucomicrobiota bacterium]
MNAALATSVGIAAALAAVACSARRGEPLTGSASIADPGAGRGRIVFMAHCHKCHPNGEAGLGPAINDKPLPEFLMKTQTRVGLGAMPSFSREQISDDELEDLIRYLKGLRGKRNNLAARK